MPDLAIAVFATAGFGDDVLEVVLAAHALEAEPMIEAFAGMPPELFAWEVNGIHHLPCVHDSDGDAGRNLAAAFQADVVGVTHV